MTGAARFEEEVLLSTRATSRRISAAVAAGRLRKIGPSLYTGNLTEASEAVVRRNLWRIVALYCPGAVVTDRTGIENRPAADGSLFVVAERNTDVELPGLRIRPRRGPGPGAEDHAFMDGLYLANPGRLVLENLRPSRARSGAARTLSRAELESYLERVVAQRGESALNAIRDQARRVAPSLGLTAELAELDRLIGALLGSREGVGISAPEAAARAAGRPYDGRRLQLFEALRGELASLPPNVRRAPDLRRQGTDNLAFFEAYFSNFIEGTEFSLEEAVDIVFKQAIPAARPEDAHDVLGTYRVAADAREMAVVPQSFEELIAILKRRHAAFMVERPEQHPGQFKSVVNRVGGSTFVAPDMVLGTLARGFEIYRSLAGAFERAVFVMYLVNEVHPFVDGNGRAARLMMSAELAAAGEQRILVPIVYRNNYLSALRALSNDASPTALVRTLDFAQRYALAIPWNCFEQARHVLQGTHAFLRPDEAEERGLRLRLPTPALLQEAEDQFPDPAPSV